ncbi:MAG: hypothetical protein KAI66_09540 [Lentisphaeria bacterium]|nr:hypothetical protein [Lentisphaeria bacterium]
MSLQIDTIAIRLLAFALVLLATRGSAAEEKTLVIGTFGKAPGKWVSRTWTETEEPVTAPLKLGGPKAAGNGVRWLEMPVDFPAKSEFACPVEVPWSGWRELQFDFFLPEGLPPEAMVTIFTTNWDHLWRQIRLPLPKERGKLVTIKIPVSGDAAGRAWEPVGHRRPWHQLTGRRLIEYGCAFAPDTGSKTEFKGTIHLAAVRLAKAGEKPCVPVVRNLERTPRVPRVGERCEFDFQLCIPYGDPFKGDSVKIVAEIITPSGRKDSVRGFYYEGFLHDPDVADKTRALSPWGAPRFKVRYCPLDSGKHRITIRAHVEGKTITMPEMTFQAASAREKFRGFVRRDPKNEVLLAWDDGTHFWGVGMNVRSPFDNRYLSIAPYSKWQNEGLTVYDRLFERYKKAGINVVEVWMCSWWLAMEWINDAPGFHGVGHYNQYRAWMLDHILQCAERNDIQLILVFNNHGKFGMMYDTEWGRNPFNKANGGYLDNCEDYFTNPQARAHFKQLCDYVVARWGYSPNILAWKLFTEVDLTGTSMEYYLQPPVAAWHKEMGAYLKQIDLHKHLVTTHWMLGYHKINDAIADLPELDLLTTDAYYQSGGTTRLLAMLRGGDAFAKAHHKPLLITEFGGSPYADSMGNLIKQAHLGLWQGFFYEAPSSPMYWWFALADEKDLYSYYTAIANFSRDEDRRGLVCSVRQIADQKLSVNEMRDGLRYYAWIFDEAYYLSDEENLTAIEHKGVALEFVALNPGAYTIEFWDCAKGIVRETRPLQVKEGQTTLTLDLPPFTRDIALKIRRANTDE